MEFLKMYKVNGTLNDHIVVGSREIDEPQKKCILRSCHRIDMIKGDEGVDGPFFVYMDKIQFLTRSKQEGMVTLAIFQIRKF